jgi:hypothetical protein
MADQQPPKLEPPKSGSASEFATALGKAELTLALVLTILAAGCHFIFFRHGGGLWRDEVNTINMVTMPTLADIWNKLQFDSFPLAWMLILRAWAAVVGPGNDTALRLLGLLVGLGLLGAVWFATRRFTKSTVPLLALVLVGLNPAIVRWGDSLRAYGFGCLTILLAAGLLWRVVQSATLLRVVLAGLAAILAVQTTYQNPFLLFAIATAAMVVAARRRQWRRVVLVGAIGLAAALTLLPYSMVISRAAQFNMVIHLAAPKFSLYGQQFARLLGAGDKFMVAVWAVLMAVAVAAAALAQVPRFSRNLTAQQRDLALFAGLTMVLAVIAYVAFVLILKYPTNAWYYLMLTVLLAVAIEAAIGVFLVTPRLRIVRLVLATGLAAACLVSGWPGFHTRQTNIDLIAAEIQGQADQDDLIVVKIWEEGITFGRYYHGPTPWMTIPDLREHKLHKYDQFMDYMTRRDVVRPNVAAVEKTLRAGHKVWIVGGLRTFAPDSPPPLDPLPTQPNMPWHLYPYDTAWPDQVDYFLFRHVLNRRVQKFGDRVNVFEKPMLEVATGWRD